MKEPPYVSSLRIELPDYAIDNDVLKARLLAKEGVKDALIVSEERSAYVKIDSKVTNRVEIESLVKSA
jgi:hypothetical protein